VEPEEIVRNLGQCAGRIDERRLERRFENLPDGFGLQRWFAITKMNMRDAFASFIPPYFHLWHLPVVFLAGLAAEGYGTIIGSGGVLIQFVLAALGMPLPVVVATDIAGTIGGNVGVIAATPRTIWDSKKLLIMLTLPFFLGGMLGTVFLIYISLTLLKWVLVAGLIGLLACMLGRKEAPPQAAETLEIDSRKYPILFIIMLILGVYSNTSGVGAGSFQRLALLSILQITIVDGMGINCIVELPGGIFSLVVTAASGLIAWPYLFALWAGAFLGGKYAVTYARRIPDVYLRTLLVFVVALYLAYLIF
jgi:uncharacterized membrane protein YfcA